MFINNENQSRVPANILNMSNNIISDKQFGDVNGDGILDTVYLIGEKKEKPLYEDIKLVIQDGSTKQSYIISLLPNYSMAYDPFITLCDFNGDKGEDILIGLPVGGSGALTYYYVITFLNNRPNYIMTPRWTESLNEKLGFEVIYKDFYKVNVFSKKLNKSLILDVSNRKESYQGSVYNRAGRLIRPRKGFIIDFPHIYPVNLDGGPFMLMLSQDIAGTSHADKLGYLTSYWSYSSAQSTWVLNQGMVGIFI